MATCRLFAALDIPDEARARVASYIESLRTTFTHLRVGWERPEKLHLTLKFFGDVEPERIALIRRALDETASRRSPFAAQLIGTGVFPNARQPRVLWIGIQDESGTLRELGSNVESASRQLGVPPEHRHFSPHLTIARVREPEKGSELAAAHLKAGFEAVGFEIAEIVLYQSQLQPSGSVYSVVSRHAF